MLFPLLDLSVIDIYTTQNFLWAYWAVYLQNKLLIIIFDIENSLEKKNCHYRR